MEIVEEERSFGSQIHLWSILGPFLTVLGASLVTIAEFPGHQLFFWCSIVSILVCCRWKILGFSISFTVLASILGHQYYSGQITDHVWYLSVNFSVLLSLFITSLSYQEIENYFYELMSEASILPIPALENSEEAAAKFNALEEQCRLLEAEKTSQLNLLEEVKKDLGDQLAEIKEEKEKLFVQLLALEKNTINQDQLAALEVGLKAKEQELFNANFRLASAQEDLQQVQSRQLELSRENERLKEEYESHAELANKAQEAELTYQSMIQELNDHIETMDMEKDLLEKTLARLQGEYEMLQERGVLVNEELQQIQQQHELQQGEWQAKLQNLEQQISLYQEKQELERIAKPASLQADLQRIAVTSPSTELKAVTLYQQLREQFAEKSAVLDETRKELFRAQERILELEKVQEEHQYAWNHEEERMYRHCQSLSFELEQLEKNYIEEIENLEELLQRQLECQNVQFSCV